MNRELFISISICRKH